MPTRATILGVSLVLGCCLTACTSVHPMAPPPTREMAVRVQPLGRRVMNDSSIFIATVKSRKSVSLRPQVGGRLLQIFIKSGQRLAAGEKIAVLDDSKQQAQVSSCEAAIESSLADKMSSEATLKSLMATKVSRISNVEFAATQLNRYRELNSQGAVSAEQVDQRRNQLAVAKAELEAIEAQIKAQQAGIGRNEKQINQARAQMKEQQEQLKYFTLRAPFAGIAGDVPARIGDYVDTSSIVTTIDQSHPMELYIAVPTSESARLEKGLVTQVVDNSGKVQESGKIFFVSPQVDNTDQSVLVKAELSNKDERLRSGQTVKARIIWEQVTALTVPTAAVTRFSGQDFVFVAVEEGPGKIHAKQKAVKLGDIDGNEYRVLAGLNSGDKIVCSGTQNLADGLPIRPQM